MNFVRQVASALASMPTPLIEIVLEYYQRVASINYHSRRLAFAGDGPDIQSTLCAFAVRMGDGSVTCWGSPRSGPSWVPEGLKNVKAIYRTNSAFAAIVGDNNTVISWGDPDYGGDCSAVASELIHVEGICGSDSAFAALKRDGTVVTWGDKRQGGDSSSVQRRLRGVKAIYGTSYSFAAVLDDGTVKAWGDLSFREVPMRLGPQRVQCITGNGMAFAALLSDGTVETWGKRDYGGGGCGVGLTQVELICATDGAFAALRRDGTVVTWGDYVHGGDSSEVQGELKEVVTLCAAAHIFTAVRSDGCVVTWGRGKELPNYPFVETRGECSNMGLTDAVAIYGSLSAFAALRRDGTVTTWNLRGFVSDSLGRVAELKDIVEISAATNVFAALRRDGKVATWSDTRRRRKRS